MHQRLLGGKHARRHDDCANVICLSSWAAFNSTESCNSTLACASAAPRRAPVTCLSARRFLNGGGELGSVLLLGRGELRRAGGHVVDVVGVARAVAVRVAPALGLVFNVGVLYGDAACLFLRPRVNLVVCLGFPSHLLAV